MEDKSDRVVSIVPGRSDKEMAAEFKQRLVEVHEPILKLLDEMKEHGFEANVMMAPGPLGKFVIAQLVLMKRF